MHLNLIVGILIQHHYKPVATRIIKEINLDDKNHPIIKGIIDYLASNNEFFACYSY